MAKFDELYYQRKELYERAIKSVEDCITDIIKDYSGDKLFRVNRVTSRLKNINSLRWKAYKESIRQDEKLFDEILDIAGVRVVVNNLSDIKKVIEKIKESKKMKFDESSYKDKVSSPDKSGYRAVHFNVIVNVEDKGEVYKIPCEVQIRTLFQDGWAILSHTDIYINVGEIPPMITKLSKRLADQLAVMDDIAEDIREELSKRVEPVGSEDPKAPIPKQELALVYYELFSEKPTEFNLQIGLKELSESGIVTAEKLRNATPSSEILKKLGKLAKENFPGLGITNMDLLVWGAKVGRFGEKLYREFIDEKEKEWEEVQSARLG